MKRLLNFSLFLVLTLTTALLAAAGEASMTYNGINYTFYYSGSGASAVGDSAVVARQSTSFSGAANIPSTVVYQYTYVSGYDNQGNAIYTTRNLSAPVTSIRNSAFEGCSSLTSVSIPNSVSSIGSFAFAYCRSLTSVTIPNSVKTIGDYAFADCRSLTSVTIPNSVSAIYDCTFDNCSSLTSVTIGSSVKTIGNYAFADCSSLRIASIGSSVKTIGDYAFEGCSSLTSVTIPNSVTTIGNSTFYGCTSLPNITIPNSVTSIGIRAFYRCSLTSVTIPNSVTTIGVGAFSRCSGLTSMKVASGNRFYDSRNNCNAIIETTSNTLIAGCQNTIIPNSVTTIGNYAFDYCSSLTSITIPNSVTTIGYFAFFRCSSLTSVTIPNSVTSIGNYAFASCTSLTSVTIPNSVTTIDYYAFAYCYSLTSVTIPNSVTTIDYCAFAYCSSLTSVTCLAETPPTAYSDTFSDYSVTLYVPARSLYEYQTTEPWKNFYTILPIGQEYSISLNETNVVIEKGDFVRLKPTVTPDDDFAPTVTWSSSNPSVATVDEWGIVTGVGTGNAVITARAGNASATCRVQVVQHTVTLDQSSVSIQQYSTVQLHATVTPYDGYEPTVTWSSSRPGVATVTQDGLVKGYMTGTATITAQAGQSTATCVVTVTPILATGITLNYSQEEMTVGQVTRIIAYVAPSDVTNGNVSWSASGNGVISASWNGNECLVMAEKAGTATVTARTTDGTNLSATCVIKVSGSEPVYIPVESITLNKSTLRMNVNTTRHLTATVLPTYASDRSVSWSSSNTSIVTVDEHGAVTALKTGVAIIRATTNGVTDLGNHLTVQCVVTVLASGGNTDVLPGDVNADGQVNIADVADLIRYLLSSDPTGIDLDNTDVNQDGLINIADVTELIKMLLNRTPSRR